MIPVPAEQSDTLSMNPTDDMESPSKSEMQDNDPQAESKQAAVKMWLEKVASAKRKWDPDFKRMREDVEFAVGYQRTGQASLDTDEYQCNLVLRNINQKVAALYAKNPTAEWQRQKRMDYQLWDGKMETIQPLAMKVAMGGMLLPQEQAVVQDFIQGEQTQQGIEKVGKTLQYVYQYQLNEHDPDFKLQMKSLVRRTCTCGVSFIRLAFVRDIDNLTTQGLGNEPVDQAKRLHLLLEQIKEESQDTSSPKLEEVKMLLASMQMTIEQPDVEFETKERLSFDFLSPMSVIPDENCTNLKGFVGARFVAIEYILPLDEVNAYFETDIKAGGGIKLYKGDGAVEELATKDIGNLAAVAPKVCLIEILDKAAKNNFFLVDGYKNYVQEPAPLEPQVKGFWPVFTLMFNDVESVPDARATIYPPSDVFLIKHAQKEWNRCREELRKHRNANAAKYLTKKGQLTETDKDKLENSESNAVIELEGALDGQDVGKLLTPMQHDNIQPGDPRYDVAPLLQDILLAVGAQEANIGPPNPQGTATGQSIAEQSRSVGISSNVDDLDDFLSQLAAAGGEMLLQEMSLQTVQEIVGPGAAWPQQNKKDFLNEIFLRVVAASSGRPNKVLDLQNWQMIAPVLQAAGANPMFMVRETIKRVDDRLDPSEAFPLVPPATAGGPPQGQQSQGRGKPPAHKTGNQPPAQNRPGPGQLNAPNGQPISQGQPIMAPA